jgi:sterol desaturase/sphingolipid hydroxylase (fatty acid hydroxylase superfamily)
MKSTTAVYYSDFIVYPALLGAAALWTVPSRLRGMPLWLAFFFLGVFSWTLTEYVVHRYAFHRLPVLSQLHEAHHVEPREHLGTPFWVGALALAVVLVVLVSAIGRSAGGGAGTGLIAGYLWYLCVHHAIHRWSALRFSYLRRARRSHSRHHLSPDECNFGVTTDFWDRVFRTYTATLWLSRGETHSSVLSRAAHDDREPLMEAPVAAPEPSGLRRGHRLWRDHRPASQSRPRPRDASARLSKTQPCTSSPKD